MLYDSNYETIIFVVVSVWLMATVLLVAIPMIFYLFACIKWELWDKDRIFVPVERRMSMETILCPASWVLAIPCGYCLCFYGCFDHNWSVVTGIILFYVPFIGLIAAFAVYTGLVQLIHALALDSTGTSSPVVGVAVFAAYISVILALAIIYKVYLAVRLRSLNRHFKQRLIYSMDPEDSSDEEYVPEQEDTMMSVISLPLPKPAPEHKIAMSQENETSHTAQPKK